MIKEIIDKVRKRRSLTKHFIDKSVIKHKGKYSYKKTNYVNVKNKLIITCPIHGDFDQIPDNHLAGKGCKKCGAKKGAAKRKSSILHWIKRARKKHFNRYIYFLVAYKKIDTPVKIICKEHGVFDQNANQHALGANCPTCATEENAKKLSKDIENFIKEANIVHADKYTYEKSVYKTARLNLIITCPIHGDFDQIPDNHLAGKGCSKCSTEKNRLKNMMSMEEYIKRAIDKHGMRYSYEESIYNGMTKEITITCLIHGDFVLIAKNHIADNPTGCPECEKKLRGSKGERKIEEVLKDLNLRYEKEKTFEGCVDKGKLRFDFYLNDFDLCLEFDGEQHYIPVYRGSKKGRKKQTLRKIAINNLKVTKRRDDIKSLFCYNEGIYLIRIPFLEFNRIEEIIKKVIEGWRPEFVFLKH